VVSWIRKCERIFRAFGWDEKRMLQQASSCTGHFARSWCDEETEDWEMIFGTWGEFKAKIIECFRPAALIKRYGFELRRRKQEEDKDVSAYYNDKFTNCDLVNPERSDADVIEQLLEGLHVELYSHVGLVKAKTRTELYGDLVRAQIAGRRVRRNGPYGVQFQQESESAEQDFRMRGGRSRGDAMPCLIFR